MTWDARDSLRNQPRALRKKVASPTDEEMPATPIALPSHQLADLLTDTPGSLDADSRELRRLYHANGWHTPRDVERQRRLMTRGIQPWRATEDTP